jgi:hypothetical protein
MRHSNRRYFAGEGTAKWKRDQGNGIPKEFRRMALERPQRSENIVALAEELLTWSLAGLQARQEWRG